MAPFAYFFRCVSAHFFLIASKIGRVRISSMHTLRNAHCSIQSVPRIHRQRWSSLSNVRIKVCVIMTTDDVGRYYKLTGSAPATGFDFDNPRWVLASAKTKIDSKTKAFFASICSQ